MKELTKEKWFEKMLEEKGLRYLTVFATVLGAYSFGIPFANANQAEGGIAEVEMEEATSAYVGALNDLSAEEYHDFGTIVNNAKDQIFNVLLSLTDEYFANKEVKTNE